MKQLIDDVDRAIESLQLLRSKLRLLQAEERALSLTLVNHAHGTVPFHDHEDSASTGAAHERAHDDIPF